MFVVGTVLYRNLGSFLALQRWAPWGYGGRPGLGEMGMLGMEGTGVSVGVQERGPEVGLCLQEGWLLGT